MMIPELPSTPLPECLRSLHQSRWLQAQQAIITKLLADLRVRLAAKGIEPIPPEPE
jgi:hypothetical protein